MKKVIWTIFLSLSFFIGMGTGSAQAEETTSVTAPDVVITTNESGTPIATSSSPAPVVTTPVVVQPQTTTTTTPTQPAKTTTPSSSIGASPATDSVLKSTANGSLQIAPIPISDFVNHLERKMLEIVMGIRQFSVPYAIFVVTIGGLVLMIPFKMPMQKGLGFGIIGFGLLGFVMVWFSPVILGIAKSMAVQ